MYSKALDEYLNLSQLEWKADNIHERLRQWEQTTEGDECLNEIIKSFQMQDIVGIVNIKYVAAAKPVRVRCSKFSTVFKSWSAWNLSVLIQFQLRYY